MPVVYQHAVQPRRFPRPPRSAGSGLAALRPGQRQLVEVRNARPAPRYLRLLQLGACPKLRGLHVKAQLEQLQDTFTTQVGLYVGQKSSS